MSDFQRGVVAERERVTRIIRELRANPHVVGEYLQAVDDLLVALGVEDDQ